MRVIKVTALLSAVLAGLVTAYPRGLSERGDRIFVGYRYSIAKEYEDAGNRIVFQTATDNLEQLGEGAYVMNIRDGYKPFASMRDDQRLCLVYTDKDDLKAFPKIWIDMFDEYGSVGGVLWYMPAKIETYIRGFGQDPEKALLLARYPQAKAEQVVIPPKVANGKDIIFSVDCKKKGDDVSNDKVDYTADEWKNNVYPKPK
ncbi:Uu.00g107340.m01.CDS01 [Anthostomella pinea]|uniref:Uu.00g107340.m01.CDS01 n=1 Tax=Anthostomella pinea TaxID=933095 RepID=A0AAI8VED5_9PEZI|nr:Uu.00g107340.m01.CDS01 [Anthostomella pinea]